MPDVDATVTAGIEARGYRRGSVSTDSWDQYVIPTRDRITSYRGRVSTFVTAGRAATSQKIAAIHNATSSTVIVGVNRIRVDVLSTVVKAVTVVPPIIRCQRFTAVPTNGTALTKVPLDTALSSSSSVTVWGDSSADNAGAGTPSGTTLAITPGSILAQAWTPRVISAVGYEPLDPVEFFAGETDVTLRALEGLVIFLDQAVATTGNPATDRWLVVIDWEEYTRP